MSPALGWKTLGPADLRRESPLTHSTSGLAHDLPHDAEAVLAESRKSGARGRRSSDAVRGRTAGTWPQFDYIVRIIAFRFLLEPRNRPHQSSCSGCVGRSPRTRRTRLWRHVPGRGPGRHSSPYRRGYDDPRGASMDLAGSDSQRALRYLRPEYRRDAPREACRGCRSPACPAHRRPPAREESGRGGTPCGLDAGPWARVRAPTARPHLTPARPLGFFLTQGEVNLHELLRSIRRELADTLVEEGAVRRCGGDVRSDAPPPDRLRHLADVVRPVERRVAPVRSSSLQWQAEAADRVP
jgi:hypothetical protein